MTPRKRLLFSIIILGLAGVLCFAGVQQVLAANLRVTLEPIAGTDGKSRNVFDLITDPGSTVTDTAVIRNGSNEVIKAFVFPSGFEVRDGKVEPVQAVAGSEPDPGTWITVAKTEVIIPVGGRVEVPFTIKVPERLDVGEHTATLFTQGQSLKSSGTNQSGMTIIVRNGVRVYMVVPGQIDRTLKISSIHHRILPIWSLINRKLYFRMNVENKGNIRLRPKTNVTVRGLFGKVGEMKDVEFILVNRDSTTTAEMLWNRRAPLFGRFVANFEIHLGEKEQVNVDRTRTMLPDQVINARYVFWIFPWIYLLYLLILGFIIYLLRSIFLYFVIINRLKIKTDTYTVKTGDTLMKVASKLGVDPTVLAKFNFLAWPYHLQAGDKLLVPTGKMSHSEWRGRAGSLLASKEFLGGIFGHLFNMKAVRHISHKLENKPETAMRPNPSVTEYEILIADKGDTIHDIADFAGVSPQTIIKANRLKSPYRLRAGQELKVPRLQTKSKRK